MELNMEQPHPVEEQRHSGRTLATWSAVVASAVFVAAFLVWVMVVQPYDRTQSSDGRSNEQSGQSVAARDGPLVPKLNPTTGGRPQNANENAREIDQSSAPLKLSDKQREQIRLLIAGLPAPPRVTDQPFTVSVGAAVPNQVPLKQLPTELATLLNGFQGDDYVLVGDQLVIVDATVRRVVAIIPKAT